MHTAKSALFLRLYRRAHALRLIAGLVLLAPALPAEKLDFTKMGRDVVEARLERISRKVGERKANLRATFEQAGCRGDRLSEQKVKRHRHPNVICALEGTLDATIIVGAHFDLVDAGSGAVDNWSGAAMLPSLYQALAQRPRRHKFLFVGFAGEEKGLIGSSFYVQQLTPAESDKTRVYVNLDCLGLGETNVWLSRSDKRLSGVLSAVAQGLGLRLNIVNADKVASDDAAPFIKRGIPIVSIHSITNETIPILHSKRDQLSAIDRDRYYETYTLLAAYLTYLDSHME